MGRRGYYRGSRKTDAGTGCLFSIINLLFAGTLMLILSDNPTTKKFGWGIIVGILFLLAMASAGVSPDTALAVIGVVILIGLIIFLVYAFCGDSSSTSSSQEPEDLSPQSTTEISSRNEETIMTTSNDNTLENNAYKSATITLLEPKKENIEVKPVIPPTPIKLPEAQVVQEKKEIVESIKAKAPVQLSEEEKPALYFLKPGEKPTYYASVEDAVKRFSVPDDYQKVMIESIRKTDVKKCPGLVWKDAEKFYVLPLFSNGRYISFKLDTITEIEYKKVPDIDTSTDYMELVKEPIAKEFEELYPEYGFDMDGAYTHNFVIGGNITVTNTSAKAVFRMLQKGLRVEDEFTLSAQYEDEIKDIYRAYILKLNGVLSFEEYAKIRQEKLDAYRNREKDDKKYNEQIKACKARGMI